jgi:subtilisin family serine protease
VSGAVAVAPVNTYHIDDDVSNNLINAPAVWSALGGQSNAGAGVKIGIIDTGIDQTHPFLTDNTLAVPAGFPKCDAIDSSVGQADTSCLFTSNKVIVAKVFQIQAKTNFDAHAAQAHGSHVSGIAAGVANTCAPFVGCQMSGVAPKAYLGNYNVFPGNILGATSLDIAMAVETAVSDGMDVLNLSLGGGAIPNDVLVNAVNSAVDAGVVVAIAAGNAGPGVGTIESPGIARNVITVGASTDPHFVGIPVSPSGLGTFGGALGQFANFVPAITAMYATTTPANGCTSIAEDLSSEIALIARGACTFSTKIRNAETAGAIGVLVYNSVLGDPSGMAKDGTPNQPTIPAVMVSRTNGLAMAAMAPSMVTVDGTNPQQFLTAPDSADILASFSSIGPPILQTPGQGNGQPQGKVKPDVVAPGVNVLSSVPAFFCGAPPCFAFFSGTSMATPHVAGSAAILKQLHPTWSPEQIKSALVTTGDPVKSFRTGSPLTNPMVRGGGRIDLANAGFVSATVEADPGQASVDFGLFPAQSFSRGDLITVTDTSGSDHIYTITVNMVQSTGPVVTVPTSITVRAGSSTSFTATLTATPFNTDGDSFGYIVLSSGAQTLRIPYWVELASSPHAGSVGVHQV